VSQLRFYICVEPNDRAALRNSGEQHFWFQKEERIKEKTVGVQRQKLSIGEYKEANKSEPAECFGWLTD